MCVSQCVCARAPHKRVCAISLSLSLSLSLCIHRGIDNHKVRGDNEHGPQAAGVRLRSVPAAIGSQHALARCQQPARDFVAADSQKFQAAAEGDRGRKAIFELVLGSTIWYSTVARLVHIIDVAGTICVPLQIALAWVQIPHGKPHGKRRPCRAAPGARGQLP